MSHTLGPWQINPVTGTYRCIGSADHSDERLAMLAAIGKMQFEALSIGDVRGQIAIIPLDESNRDNARLIASAPDLLALAEQYLSECAECSGTGVQVGLNPAGDYDKAFDADCADCKFIRDVIAKAKAA